MLILVWLQLGYCVVVFMSGMARVDPSLHEAASLDGASWLQRFRIVTVNELRPEVAVVLLTTTVASLKVFAPIYVLTSGGPGNATMVPSYFAFYNFFTTMKVGYGAAISTILAAVLTVAAIVMLRLQRSGEATR
jgi:raffinose/stachyose/melibiose transport system permease protein